MIFQQLYEHCIKNRLTVSCAESCTSGLISSKITTISGSSSIFKGGIIAYQNEIKIGLLSVPRKLIEEKTEVCFEVVEQMALSIRKICLSDFSIATSGYSGPTGGTKLNPVGSIFIAISSNKRTISKRFIFEGDRDSIVNQSVDSAVGFLLQELKNKQ